MNTTFREISVYLDILAMTFKLATKDELESDRVVVSTLRTEDSANAKLIRANNIRTVSWTQPEDLSDEEVGPARRHFLTENYSSTLLGFEACGALERHGIYKKGYSGLSHLQAWNNGEVMGPLFTFDRELLTIDSAGKRHEFVLGIRYDKKEGHFRPVARELTSLYGKIAMQKTLALVSG